MILKIPSVIAWRQDDDLAIYHPTPKISSVLQYDPVRWTIRRLLSHEFSTGRELFFTKPEDIDAYEKTKSRVTVIPPFFVWPNLLKIYTNDLKKTKEIMYYLGEFEIEASQKLENGKRKLIRHNYLNGFDSLFLQPKVKGNQQDEYQTEQNVDFLWTRIFELIGEYREKPSIYWFEDDETPLEEAELSIKHEQKKQPEHSQKKQDREINIYTVTEDLYATPEKESFDDSKSILSNIPGLLKSSSFNIFIVDMLSQKKIELLGPDIIKAVRKEEPQTNAIKNLIIVYTGGYSPFIVSRSKALKADLIVFKRTGGETKGMHESGTTSEGQFLLFWSIYWPIAVLRYLNIRLKAIAEIDPNRGVKPLKNLYDEITKICPEGVFYFWQDWLNEVKQILQKWRSIMLPEGSYLTVEDYKTFQKEIKELISKAGFQIDADQKRRR